MSVLTAILKKHQHSFSPLLPFNPETEKLSLLNLTDSNTALNETIFNNLEQFCGFINQTRRQQSSRYLIGGYNEHRTMYSRSSLFDGEEPRRLHLGLDIWGDAGTPVFAFMGGMVHSIAFNHQLGDYGATMIMLHQLDAQPFYTLYGHISLADIEKYAPGQYINREQVLAHFGTPEENGQWPPHLHFQVIHDIGLYEGDYPGVCRLSEKEQYLANCPDPDIIANLYRFVTQ